MTQDNSGLLIAALVAIVAVVGLVILFNGQATGAFSLCPDGYAQHAVSNVGGQTGYTSCVPAGEGLYPQHNLPLVGGANTHYYHTWYE